MARIDYVDNETASERTREVLAKNRNANIFRMMAHSGDYLEQYCRLGRAIRSKGEIDPVLRELAITRTGILCEAPYEVAAHKRIGKNVGVTDEVVKLHRPHDATLKAIASKLTPGALIELQLSIGFYVMTSKFLETFGIDLQPVEEVV